MDAPDKPLERSLPPTDNLEPEMGGPASDNPAPSLATLIANTMSILRARLRLFLVVVLLILVGTIVAAYVRSPKYESAAKLMVQLDMQTVALSQAEIRYNLAMKMADEAVGTQVELLRSRELIERVIDQVGEDVLQGKPKTGIAALIINAANGARKFVLNTLVTIGLIDATSPRQDLVKTISDGLKILPARKSQMIDISLRLKHREATQRILAALIEQHIKRLAEMEATSQAYEVYNEQAAQLKAQLEKAESAIASFKLKHNFVDLASEKAMLLQNAERLKSTLDGAHGSQTTVPGSGEGESEDGVIAGTGGNDIARLVSRVNELRLEKVRRTIVYAPGHIKLDEVEGQLAAAERQLASKVKSATAAVEGYLARRRALDSIQPEFARLTRETSVLEDNYKAYMKATEDRRLSKAKDRRVLLIVVDSPPIPEGAVPPTRLMVVLGGLVGSLLLATAFVLVVNRFSNRKTLGKGEVSDSQGQP